MTKPEKKEKEEETIKQLVLPDTLTIKELADKMKVAPAALVKKLFLQGKVVTINEEIDYDAAEGLLSSSTAYVSMKRRLMLLQNFLRKMKNQRISLFQDHQLSALWDTLIMVRLHYLMQSEKLM